MFAISGVGKNKGNRVGGWYGKCVFSIFITEHSESWMFFNGNRGVFKRGSFCVGNISTYSRTWFLCKIECVCETQKKCQQIFHRKCARNFFELIRTAI